MKRALICIDPDAVSDSLDLLTAVNQMYGTGTCQTYGLDFGAGAEQVQGVLDVHIRLKTAPICPYDIGNLTNCIQELQAVYRFDAILILATTFGRMLAPRLAMRLHVGLVADVTAIRRHNEHIEFVRPAFSGRMLAGIVTRGCRPLMLSVRPNTFRGPHPSNTKTTCISFTPERMHEPAVQLLGRESKSQTQDIRESEVLVAGGGGMKRHFAHLSPLAEQLGGMVAVSRRLVDAGVAPRRIQVGLSGKTVSPQLYIAVGISGSIQHVVGLKNVQYLIAVNRNRHAPLCSLADIVVEGDGQEFLQRLRERIRCGPKPPSEADQSPE